MLKTLESKRCFLGSLGAFALFTQLSFGQGETLKNELVSYWPLDEVQGNKTPDLKNGYDLILDNFTASDLIPGQKGMAFRFAKARKTLLSRAHDPADDLPANKHNSFTISFWAKVTSAGQNDLRVMAEGSTTDNSPIFTLGTRQGVDANGSLDVFIRQGDDPPHLRTTTEPFDGVDWRHVCFVQTVQIDGSSTRQIYIDGMLDDLVIEPKAADLIYNMNTTAIGGLLRSSPTAHIDGDIDEVAIWKRALTPAEITDLMANGIPSLDEVQEDLAINSFSSEYRKVISGDQVKLSWDATKDATLSISPAIGDVTAIGEFGVGSTLVTITEPTTFTLTASRDGDEDITSTLNVSPITDIAAGWNWIEDFNDFASDTALDTQGGWAPVDGIFNVATIGDTQALRQDAGRDLAGRDLGTHQIIESSSGTLFFRFCVSDEEADLPINLKVGLTEKGFRLIDDWEENIGTYVIFSREAGGNLQLQAINGIDGIPIDSGLTFETNRSYDVWINVTNNPIGDVEPDRFTVHIAPSGGARMAVFENFASDREPQEITLIGAPRPEIDSIFLASFSGGGVTQASQALAFDDFYMSSGNTLLTSVPTPSSFGKVEPGPPLITAFSYNSTTGAIELTWKSQPNTNYSLDSVEELETVTMWSEVEDSIPSTGTSTTKNFPGPFATKKTFFRLRVQ